MPYNMDEHIGYIRMMYFVNHVGKIEVWDNHTFCKGLYPESEDIQDWVDEWLSDLDYMEALDFFPELVASHGVWEISGELWVRFDANYSVEWIGPEYDAYLWVGDDNLTFEKLDSIRAFEYDPNTGKGEWEQAGFDYPDNRFYLTKDE